MRITVGDVVIESDGPVIISPVEKEVTEAVTNRLYPYHCPWCPSRFESAKARFNHYQREHSEHAPAKKVRKPRARKRMTCDHCGQGYLGHANQRFCSTTCKQRYYRVHGPVHAAKAVSDVG